MTEFLKVDPSLTSRFPGLAALIIHIREVEVEREKPELDSFKADVVRQVREKWTLEQLREHPVFRAYRDFFWRIGVDPTKTRPAAEALIRRILHGSPLPRINTLVDSYNIASIDTAIALAAFDEDKLAGELLMRAAEPGEEFLGIGMDKPAMLKGGEVVITDGRRLVAIYPHRDADFSKVTEGTGNVLMLICGVPNIAEETLTRAGQVTVNYVIRFCDGSES